jgi:hypothetical protein
MRSSRDVGIEQAVADALGRHPYLARRQIDVDVEDGVVRLIGSVADRLGKQAAWDIAWSIRGVADVELRLRIEPAAVTVGALRRDPAPRGDLALCGQSLASSRASRSALSDLR